MLPSEFTNRMKDLLGDDYDKFIASFDEAPVRSFRINTNKISEEDFLAINPFGGEKISYADNAYYFSFDGIGNCPNGYKFQMPSATNVEGWDGKWYTADGTGYLPSEIPEMTAATYYAVKPVTP